MAGILVLLCEWVYEDVWHILAFLAFGLWLPNIAVCIAFIFEGYFKYQKGSCVTGQQLLPSLALPRLLFFPLWLVMWELLALSGWVVWFYHGRWCESFIPLFIWAGAFIITAFWPIMMFVVNSFLLSFLVFAFSTFWIILLIGATVVFAFDVVAILLQVLFLVWVAFNAVWTFIAWRNKGFRFPSVGEIVRDVYGVLGGTPIGGGGGGGGGVIVGQGQGQFTGTYGAPPSPCSGTYTGGPLGAQCPTAQFVSTELGTPPGVTAHEESLKLM